MFASLVLATRGRPFAVWIGAAAAFALHVVIATTVGVALFRLLPHRVVDAIVALMFAASGVWALRETGEEEADLVVREASSHSRVMSTAFVVIFIAEWGDLTQILTANLAAHYRDGLSVAVGAVLALWSVAALAVVGGSRLLRHLSIRAVRRMTGVILLVLALYAGWSAVTG
jgi:putative Ca2+/H+ antiporter (TMEM165/GDT1 family)